MVKVDLTEKVKGEQRLQIGKGESHGYVGGKGPRQRCKGPGAEVGLSYSRHSSRSMGPERYWRNVEDSVRKQLRSDYTGTSGPP